MTIEQKIIDAVIDGVRALYGAELQPAQVQLQKTKKEFEGNLTVVVFPFVKMARKSPEATATELGEYLKNNAADVVAAYNVVKGFLNLVISQQAWIALLNDINKEEKFGFISTPFSPNQLINSKSIFCGSCRQSTNTNRQTNCSRSRQYRSIIFFSVSRCFCPACAKPYPGKSIKCQETSTKKWLINKVLPGF